MKGYQTDIWKGVDGMRRLVTRGDNYSVTPDQIRLHICEECLSDPPTEPLLLITRQIELPENGEQQLNLL